MAKGFHAKYRALVQEVPIAFADRVTMLYIMTVDEVPINVRIGQTNLKLLQTTLDLGN